MAASMKKTNDVETKRVESKQLLYSDVFGESYQEDRLRIVGKSNSQDRRQTYSVPQSSVLSQIKSFLPQLSNANMKLAEDIEKNPQRAQEINIECIDEDLEGKHIEMNLSMIRNNNEESSGESDSSSDDGNNEGVNSFDEQPKSTSDCDTYDKKQAEFKMNDGETNEQQGQMKLKLPSAKYSGRKQRIQIEEIECKTNTYQNKSSNG